MPSSNNIPEWIVSRLEWMIRECDEAIEQLESFAEESSDKPVDMEAFRVVRHKATVALEDVKHAVAAGQAISADLVDEILGYLQKARIEDHGR